MIGLEESLEAHLEALVQLFREVRRVLRKDGTVWLNYGDAYANGGRASYQSGVSKNMGHTVQDGQERPPDPLGIKPKDLLMLPARVALALQADGWWIRSEIVWHKPNPMPESVGDRPTSAHEKVFLLSRSAKYFYDAEAVRVPSKSANRESFRGDPAGKGGQFRHGAAYQNQSGPQDNSQATEKQLKKRDAPTGWGSSRAYHGADPRDGRKAEEQADKGWEDRPMANLRNVWSIPVYGFSGAHFATFPPDLVEPCIKAGTSEYGVCVKCGAPWERAAEGWRPTCKCRKKGTFVDLLEEVTKPVVLDPFGGSGTTALVADRQGRDAILIEISEDYADMARARIHGDAPLFATVE